MMSTFHTKCKWVLNIAVLIALVLAIVPAQSIRAADPPFRIFLPLITKPFEGISGRVTFNGAGAAGESLDFCYMVDPQNFNCTSSNTPTDSDGYYYFSSSLLTPGRQYEIIYWNPGLTYNGKLYYWLGQVLDPYAANSNIVMQTFDIADVPLLSPASGGTVSLPFTFQWSKRSDSPTDSYKIYLYNTGAGFASSLLGYVDSFQLTSLPAGFYPTAGYAWSVGVFSPDGGHGRSFYKNPVTFSNNGLFQSGFMSGIVHRHYLINGRDYLIPSFTP